MDKQESMMRVADYDVSQDNFLSWEKQHTDVDAVRFYGSASIDVIDRLVKTFDYRKYSQVLIGGMSIFDYDLNGHIITYETPIGFYHGIRDGKFLPLEKIFLNYRHYNINVYKIIGNTILSEDEETIVHNEVEGHYIVPSSAKRIGDYAFCDYEEITKLTLHNGLKEIGDFAFCNIEITDLDLPDSITKLGKGAFAGVALENLKLPSYIDDIPQECFVLNYLEDINIPPSVKHIGSDAFRGARLTCLHIPEGVEHIDSSIILVVDIVYLPSTLKEIASDFYYVMCVDDSQKPPYIKMNPDNPIFYSKKGSLYFRENEQCALDGTFNGFNPIWGCKYRHYSCMDEDETS